MNQNWRMTYDVWLQICMETLCNIEIHCGEPKCENDVEHQAEQHACFGAKKNRA